MIEHFVQFYENDAYLLNQVAIFIRTGLHAGDAAIVLATQSHRDGLEKRLKTDIACAAAQHPETEPSYTELDANESRDVVQACAGCHADHELRGLLRMRAAEGGCAQAGNDQVLPLDHGLQDSRRNRSRGRVFRIR